MFRRRSSSRHSPNLFVSMATTVAAMALLSVPVMAQHDSHNHAPTSPQGTQQPMPEGMAKELKSDPYPLDTCPVTGKKLGVMGDPVVKEYDGREVRFCCGM